jgi:hypothetical protein
MHCWSQCCQNPILKIITDHHKLGNSTKVVNLIKWAVQETKWLGYWLTLERLKPRKKNIDSIIKMQSPATIKQICSFIGAVSFYQGMFL